jgi:preprotein translocase subunit SecG
MQVLNIFHVLVAIAMIAFILVQRGPGATAGAAFGSGASGTVFGSRGAGSFLSRATWILATLFCLISLTMAVVVSRDLSAPDTDLGVVAAPGAVEQTAVEPSFEAPEGESETTDLPILDTVPDPAAELDPSAATEDDMPVPGDDSAADGTGADDGSDGTP